MKFKQNNVVLVSFEPGTIGREIKKTRPAVIISPDEMNDFSSLVIVAPMTSTIKEYPTRVPLTFKGKKGEVALDQLRSIDKERVIKKVGSISLITQKKISDVLLELFACK